MLQTQSQSQTWSGCHQSHPTRICSEHIKLKGFVAGLCFQPVRGNLHSRVSAVEPKLSKARSVYLLTTKVTAQHNQEYTNKS